MFQWGEAGDRAKELWGKAGGGGGGGTVHI